MVGAADSGRQSNRATRGRHTRVHSQAGNGPKALTRGNLSGGSPILPPTSCWPYVVLCLLTISTPKGRGASGTVAVLRTLKNIVFSKCKRGHRTTGRVLLQGSELGPHRTQMEGDREPLFSRSVGRVDKPWGDTLMLLPEAGREVSGSRRGSSQTADLTQVWWASSLPGLLPGQRDWPVWISGLARALRLSSLPPVKLRAVWPAQGSTNPWPILGRWEGEIYQ